VVLDVTAPLKNVSAVFTVLCLLVKNDGLRRNGYIKLYLKRESQTHTQADRIRPSP